MKSDLQNRLSSLSPDKIKALMRKVASSESGAATIGKMPRNPDNVYPMSSAQERMWFLCKLTDKSHIYNNPLSVSINVNNELQPDIFERSLWELARRHEILRTTFEAKDGKPVQIIHPEAAFRVELNDLRGMSPEMQREIAVSEAKAEAQKPIDISSLPLLNFKMLRLSENEYIQLITPHHIISDGWSNMLFAKELGAIYNTFAENKALTLPEPPFQYIDYVHWEQQWTKSKSYGESLQFWKNLLSDNHFMPELPLDYIRPKIMKMNGAIVTSILTAEVTAKLKLYSQTEQSTLFHTLFALFNIFIFKLTGFENPIIGVPAANRNRREFQGVLGLFMNTLPLCTQIANSMQFKEYLAQVRKVTAEALLHQELPFERLIEELNPKRDTSRTPLFQIMFVHQNMPSIYKLPGMEMKPFKVDYGSSKFDLNLWIEEVGDELLFTLTYNSDIFKQTTAKRFIGYYCNLIENMLAAPDESIGGLSLIRENPELNQWKNPSYPPLVKGECLDFPPLVKGGRGDFPTTHTHYFSKEGKGDYPTTFRFDNFLKRFKTQNKINPDSPAVYHSGKCLTYSELNRQSNRLARLIQEKKIPQGSIIAFFAPRTEQLIVGILGIMKCGCAYLPIDTSLPIDRIKYILADANTALALATLADKDIAVRTGIDTIYFDSEKSISNDDDDVTYLPEITQDTLAYVIYTSGTTGNPKGVCISHANLLNYIDAICEVLQPESKSRFATVSSPAADLGNTMIFPALACGGSIDVIGKDTAMSPAALTGYFSSNKPDYLKIVPSHITVLLNQANPAGVLPEKMLVLGGEACSPFLIEKIRKIKPDLRIINHYGPTETTIGVTTYEIPANFDKSDYALSIPIGKALSGNEILILDEMMLQQPICVPGEIYIAGRQVSSGYLNIPDLTNERFIENSNNIEDRLYKVGYKNETYPLIPSPEGTHNLIPSQEGCPEGTGCVSLTKNRSLLFYKTGDKGRLLDDGNIEFLGRIDGQIKIRGYRVELAEIENVIKRNEAVDSVIVLKPDADDPKQAMFTFVKVKKNKDLNSNQLNQFLRNILPDYMIPARVFFMDDFPVTSNGKISYSELRNLSDYNSDITHLKSSPRNEIDEAIAQIWADSLKIDKPGIDDGFFELGGHSLLAIQVLSAMETKFGVNIPLSALFDYGTIRLLSDAIIEKTRFENSGSKVIIRQGSGETCLWLVHPAGGNILCYNELAKNIDDRITVIGLQANRYSNIAKIPKSIEELADEYLREIEPDLTNGNHIFGGWSMGALVGYEMAVRHFEKHGILAPVLIFDQPPEQVNNYSTDIRNDSKIERLMFFAEKAALFAGMPLNINEFDLIDKSEEEQSIVFYNSFKKTGLVPDDVKPEQFNGFLEMMIHHNDISAAYHPRKYPGNVCVVKAQESLQITFDKEIPEGTAKNLQSESLGWERFVTGSLELIPAPGNHVTMMTAPNAGTIAKELVHLLNTAFNS